MFEHFKTVGMMLLLMGLSTGALYVHYYQYSNALSVFMLNFAAP